MNRITAPGRPSEIQKGSALLLFSALLITFVMLFYCLPARAANLIANPGFESGANGHPENWITVSRKPGNSIEWLTGDVHSGDRAVKLHAAVAEDPGKSMGLYTDFIPVPEDVYLELSSWIKAENIVSGGGWYTGRAVITMYDSERNKIAHSDVAFDGSIWDWSKIGLNKITPSGTRFVQAAFFLTACTGTIWVDDVDLSIIQSSPAVSLIGIYNPVIIPAPWMATLEYSSFPIGSLAVAMDPALGKQEYLKEEMTEFFTRAGLSDFQFVAPAEADPTRYKTKILVADFENEELIDRFRATFPEYTTAVLGDEGYFLSIAEETSQNIICLGANTERGRFYGFQTLKQALDTPSEPKAYVLNILDAPTLQRRGMVMGVQWFSKQNQAIERLSELKGNFVVNHGSFMNYKFMQKWRENFTSIELESMANFFTLCRKHFVTAHLNFGPRSFDPAIDPVEFSSDSEISLLVEKIKKLYALGFRNFGLNFDDLQNVGQEILLVDSDKAAFGDNIGKAHSSFTQAVYDGVVKACPDINFSVLPMYYNDTACITDRQQRYLSSFASLDPGIKLIACTVYDEGITTFRGLTGRPITIWSNFFSAFQSAGFSKEYTWPIQNAINWGNTGIKSSIEGFVFLPIIPVYEDPSIVSWKTAADYIWSPARYTPLTSFQRAMAQYEGVPDRASLKPPDNLRILD